MCVLINLNYSFSSTSATPAEQPQSIRPQVGASSLFENVQVESDNQVEVKQVAEKEVRSGIRSTCLSY
jgi:hypothetical protein